MKGDFFFVHRKVRSLFIYVFSFSKQQLNILPFLEKLIHLSNHKNVAIGKI